MRGHWPLARRSGGDGSDGPPNAGIWETGSRRTGRPPARDPGTLVFGEPDLHAPAFGAADPRVPGLGGGGSPRTGSWGLGSPSTGRRGDGSTRTGSHGLGSAGTGSRISRYLSLLVVSSMPLIERASQRVKPHSRTWERLIAIPGGEAAQDGLEDEPTSSCGELSPPGRGADASHAGT
jgi:hypothetical protein